MQGGASDTVGWADLSSDDALVSITIAANAGISVIIIFNNLILGIEDYIIENYLH